MINDSLKAMPGLIEQITLVDGEIPSEFRKVVFNTRCCIYQNPKVLNGIDSQFLLLEGQYYQSYKYFDSLRKELISYLRDPMEDDFTSLPKSNVICAHIRRGDFKSHHFMSTDEDFLKNAMEYIEEKEKLNNWNIVLFGDDVNFMKNLYNDTVFSGSSFYTNSTHFVSQNSPSDDLIYSKHYCDVFLITAPHSTFGWWLGYLSRGNRVYYMDIRVTTDKVYRDGRLNPVDYYLPYWIPLKFAVDNVTIVESL